MTCAGARLDDSLELRANYNWQGVIAGLSSEYGSVEKVMAAAPLNTRVDIRKRLIFWRAADRL